MQPTGVLLARVQCQPHIALLACVASDTLAHEPVVQVDADAVMVARVAEALVERLVAQLARRAGWAQADEAQPRGDHLAHAFVARRRLTSAAEWYVAPRADELADAFAHIARRRRRRRAAQATVQARMAVAHFIQFVTDVTFEARGALALEGIVVADADGVVQTRC